MGARTCLLAASIWQRLSDSRGHHDGSHTAPKGWLKAPSDTKMTSDGFRLQILGRGAMTLRRTYLDLRRAGIHVSITRYQAYCRILLIHSETP